MAYNNYGGFGYGYPQYNSGLMGYQQFNQPINQQQMMQQQAMQPQNQNLDVPFAENHYGTLKEAESYIVSPGKSVSFVNKALGEIYVKSTDQMGNPMFEVFKKVATEKNTTESVSSEFDPKDFVKQDDLKDFLTRDDLQGVLTAEKAKDFVTKQDIQKISSKLEELNKRIKIASILKEENANG